MLMGKLVVYIVVVRSMMVVGGVLFGLDWGMMVIWLDRLLEVLVSFMVRSAK